MKSKLRHITDKMATGVISAGGLMLIVIIVGMMAFIAFQVIPLLKNTKIAKEYQHDISGDIIFAGSEENKEWIYTLSKSGEVSFLKPTDQTSGKTFFIPGLKTGESISAVSQAFGTTFFKAGTNRGRLLEFEIKFNTIYENNIKIVFPEILTKNPLQLSDESITHIAFSSDGQFAASTGRNFYLRLKDDADTLISRLISGYSGITSLSIRHNDRTVFVSNNKGKIEIYGLQSHETIRSEDGISITATSFLNGEMTLIAAKADGSLTGFLPVKENGQTIWRELRKFVNESGAVTSIRSSLRNKSFVTIDNLGQIRIYHATTENLLCSYPTEGGLDVNFTPKGDGVLAISERNIIGFHLENLHPEISLGTLFGEMFYEGYDKSSYTWQSTGGSDDFEPKLSLIPLIFGTLKATFYAVLFAAPLAILGALYVSQFAHPRIRVIIKPVVEIMAALPSVVIGFLAGLWLAPNLKNVLVEIVCIGIILPFVLTLLAWIFDRLPKERTQKIRFGFEVFAVLPAIFLSIILGYGMGSLIEQNFMNGDLQQWLNASWGIRMDQRNTIVVGIAMSFAVLPIIFTISEDAMSSVPRHLTSASLALGATRWQTATRIVLPAASAGIFSAVMIGLGRAVGETMIVLMATGNTPIMDWSIFNGMRTLSANIAVEIPEAPEGGTLYRTLFLSGLLLFFMTFLINTTAEFIRQRLRKKYATF